MTENLETYIVLVGMALFVLYVLIKESIKCSKCKADYFAIIKTKQDYLGEDFANPKKSIYRNYYSCRKCNHEWTEDVYRSKREENEF